MIFVINLEKFMHANMQGMIKLSRNCFDKILKMSYAFRPPMNSSNKRDK